VFCFDGDSAGRKAAWRALEVALPVLTDGKVVSFLFLPPEDDPDTYVRREGKGGFGRALAEAKPLSQFLFAELTSRVDMATEEGRARFLAEARPLVAQIEAPALAVMLRRRLAELARIAPEEVEALIPSKTPVRHSAAPPRRTERRAINLEARLLALVLDRPDLANRIPAEALGGRTAESKALSAVLRFFAEDSNKSYAQVSEYFKDSEHAGIFAAAQADALLKQADSPDFDYEAEIVGAVDQLVAERRRNRGAELSQLVASGEATPQQRAEYEASLKDLATAKSGNPSPEERSKL